MQDTGWLQQALFYYSKRVAWRWRWTFAAIFAAIALYYYNDDAGIIIWSILAIAAFLMILGLLVFFKSTKLIAVDNSGITFYDSAIENGQRLISWSIIESISTKKIIDNSEKQQNISNLSEEPSSLFFQFTKNPFPNDFYPTHFLWDSQNSILELSTTPTQGFIPILRIINQYHLQLLKLHGVSLEPQTKMSFFWTLFDLCYDLALFVGVTAISLIIAFYFIFETSDPLIKIKKLDETELRRLQSEFERRFLAEKMDFSIKTDPVLTSKQDNNENAQQKRLFIRYFQNPPHTKQAWYAGKFSLNATFSWTDEVAYKGDYSLKIKMTKKKIGDPDITTSAWYSSLYHKSNQGYLLEAYVLTPDNGQSSLEIDAFDAQGNLISAFNSDCKKLAFKNKWLLTQYKIMAEKIPPMTHSIRFAVQQCVSEEDKSVGILYYDAIGVYAL